MCNLPIRRRVSNFCCNFHSQTVFLVLVTKIRLLVTFRVIWVKLAQRQCYDLMRQTIIMLLFFRLKQA